jgi:hypothetical protein
MSTLTSTPYSLTFDTLIQVRIAAHNALGFGTNSTVNTAGAKIRSVPDQMDPPTIYSYSDTSIVVSWTALTALTTPDNGNSDVTYYELYWDNGSGTTPSI